MTIEELQEKVIELEEQLKEKENLAKEIERLKAREVELQEHNQKLFMRITQSKEEVIKQEEKDYKSFLLSDEDLKSLSDEEIKILKEYEEEL